MQKQLHASSGGADGDGREANRADQPLRPFCGWGLLHLPPGALKPFGQNADTHFVFRVLVGGVELELGDGFAPPRCIDARFSDTFVLHPLNFYGMRNASDSAWAVLFYMHSLHSPVMDGSQ
jgi:hypothetical protein